MLEISLIVIQWIVFAYLSYKIGNKLHIEKSYPWYLIPLWNLWVLAKESKMKIKKFFLILLLILSPLIGWFFYIDIFSASAIFIMGDADGPTAIFIANRLPFDMIGTLVILIYNIVIMFFLASLIKVMDMKDKKINYEIVYLLMPIILASIYISFSN